MGSNVKRFDSKQTYPGRTVKRTVVRHARTASKGRATRSGREMKSYVR